MIHEDKGSPKETGYFHSHSGKHPDIISISDIH